MEKTINKWTRGAIPALLLHLSVGSVYAFSLFANALSQEMGYSTSQVLFTFSLAIFFLGISAAFGGKLVEQNITRSAIIGSICFLSGLVLTGISVYFKSLIGLYLGYGVIGGIGLGITYLTPCKTLMLHFKNNKGLAMGLSVMGFGFASTIASPIITSLISTISLWKVFICLALIYLIPMCLGSILLKKPIQDENVDKTNTVKFNYLEILKNPFFILCWIMFYINIHCGLALIGVASPIMKDANINITTITLIISLMGFCNGFGRIVYSTISDHLKPRSRIYLYIFILSICFILLYITKSNTVTIGLMLCMISSSYGAGFSNIAPVLADRFGMSNISKIHGMILTAWAVAGLTGNNMTSLIYKTTNSYNYVYFVLGVLYLIALSCSVMVFKITKQ